MTDEVNKKKRKKCVYKEDTPTWAIRLKTCGVNLKPYIFRRVIPVK
jgi:hypothetical protein